MNKTEKKLTAADLAMYIGCDVEWNGVVYRLSGVNADCEIAIERNGVTIWVEIEAVKPILRPLSDITDEEENETQIFVNEICFGYELGAQITRYLLSKHFDLFGWIEAGLAIRKTVNTAQ